MMIHCFKLARSYQLPQKGRHSNYDLRERLPLKNQLPLASLKPRMEKSFQVCLSLSYSNKI